MDDFKDCSKCSAKCTEDPERAPKDMACGHTLCAQCIKEFNKSNSSQCPACQSSHTAPQGSSKKKSSVREIVLQILTRNNEDPKQVAIKNLKRVLKQFNIQMILIMVNQT